MSSHGEILFVGLLVLGGLWVVTRGIMGAVACRAVLLAAWGIAACGIAVIVMKFPAICLIAVGLIAWRVRRGWRGTQYAHGTARIADLQDLCASGLLGTN